ncbi:MAG: hypothetical protein GY858_09525 [Candidatus Omnitrophica bacterium]|nr:hypothetical protein [Candidatus Omnitrophota bacterium]
MCERTLVDSAYKRLTQHFSMDVCREVPVLGRFADLVYIENNTVVAIEFKLFNWRRAIRQSYDHKLGADFSYVCMPKRKITQEMRRALKSAGVGLKFYREDGRWPFEEVISAPRSREIWRVGKTWIKKYIQKNKQDVQEA